MGSRCDEQLKAISQRDTRLGQQVDVGTKDFAAPSVGDDAPTEPRTAMM
jgi:hypothetical protein